MKNKTVAAFLFLALKLVAQEPAFSPCCPTTEVDFPCYSGGFHLDGSCIYLRPTATDGDLEYGSFITLTTSPANLNALLLEVEPPHQSGYALSLGYCFPNSNQSVDARYFSLNARGKDDKKIATQNQFIQNFLGSSYSTSKAQSEHKIDQGTLSYRFDSVIDQALNINLSLGVAYVNLRRDFDVEFGVQVLGPTPSELTGEERSRYWGVGPLIGAEFMFPLFCHFGIAGGLETEVLFGKNHSRVSSESFRNNTTNSFFSKNSSHPIVTNLNCDLGLVFSYPFTCDWGIEFKLGYQIHYYFKAINRIDPFNGYVNNPNTFPIDRSSNLGLGGPYVLVSLNQALFPCSAIRYPVAPYLIGGRQRVPPLNLQAIG